MDRVDIYLEIVLGQPLLLLPIIVVIGIYAVVPKEKKLFLALVVLVPWITIARCQGLGEIAAAAKLSSGGAYLLIALASLAHPGQKRSTPIVLWIYPAMAFIWIFMIWSTEDATVGVVLRIQWLLVTLASIFLVKTIVVYEDFLRIINALTIGCFVALLIPLSALLMDPAGAFARGIGRFEPHGANPNQIGMLFALSAPLIGLAMMVWKRNSLRPMLIGLLSLSIGMALLTASRMTALSIIFATFPIILVLTKRPMITVLGLIIVAAVLTTLMSMVESVSLDRLGSLESGRTEIWSVYAKEDFIRRPLFGLLGTSGESYFGSHAVGQHPHSAWFSMMYQGGLILLLPMMAMVAYSTVAGYGVWKNRYYLGGNPLVYSVMFMLLMAMYLQGFTNQVVYYPTYTWSFMHVVLAGLFISIRIDIQSGGTDTALPSMFDYVEEDLEEEEFQDFSQLRDSL